MAGMGHAVMGTAIATGANRAVEAAQVAMASPLLEAGAIDGARGILINITGSSSLKLSEVNEASSLIQTAAHEDANIIFGAVLDEKMGDQVKITVIATGFRDQMPDRRARMLNVSEMPVMSVPVMSVPVVGGANWMKDPAQPVGPPAPPRFLSDDEDEDRVAASAPLTISAAMPQSAPAAAAKPDSRTKIDADLVPAPVRPRFTELAEDPVHTPLPKDYASDFGAVTRAAAPAAEEQRVHAAAAVYVSPEEEAERDLDVPAFMRRTQF